MTTDAEIARGGGGDVSTERQSLPQYELRPRLEDVLAARLEATEAALRGLVEALDEWARYSSPRRDEAVLEALTAARAVLEEGRGE